MEKYQIEQIMLKKEKLIGRLCTVLTVLFNCFMLTWKIWSSSVKMLRFRNISLPLLICIRRKCSLFDKITKTNITKNKTIL